MNNEFDDIINLDTPEPRFHTRMSIERRAAQFAPFSALTGYEETLIETSRLTVRREELSDEHQKLLSRKLNYIMSLDSSPSVIMEYFRPDTRKEGGEILRKRCIVSKIDQTEGLIYFEDKSKLPLFSVLNIEGEIFNEID
ncbi:MAG: hypothetical protein K2N03_06220, partial [Muribaculaceae bacterium]|nr:hypothetical protein [Muribaculaceae bacterium]